jgi:outer membrane biosynthesis protein TonB
LPKVKPPEPSPTEKKAEIPVAPPKPVPPPPKPPIKPTVKPPPKAEPKVTKTPPLTKASTTKVQKTERTGTSKSTKKPTDSATKPTPPSAPPVASKKPTTGTGGGVGDGVGTGVGPGIGGAGGSNTAAVRESYKKMLRDSFSDLWDQPTGLGNDSQDLIVYVQLRISPSGVVEYSIVQRSGETTMDRSVEAALNRFTKTIAPPKELVADGVFETRMNVRLEL